MRIETYSNKTGPVTGDDKWIGTASETNETNNFSAAAVATYIKTNGLISTASHNTFKWQDWDGDENMEIGTITSPVAVPAELRDITKLSVSTTSYSGIYIKEYLDTFFNYYILLVDTDDNNNFAIGLVTSVSDNATNAAFKDIYISVVNSNGTASETNVEYTLMVYPTPNTVVVGTGDLSYTHTQSVASTSWAITHNLGKFASVQTVDATGVRIYGRETHNTPNQVTVLFTESITGKAYIN